MLKAKMKDQDLELCDMTDRKLLKTEPVILKLYDPESPH